MLQTPLKGRHVGAIAGLILALTGCRATIDEVATATDEALDYSNRNMLVIAAIGAAAFYLIDPLAPNWEVAQKQLTDTRFRIDLRMKRFHSGADGEAEPLFTRHAEEIAEQLGAGEYRLLSYTEGIDSNVTVPQRWAKGVIELVPARRPARIERTAKR